MRAQPVDIVDQLMIGGIQLQGLLPGLHGTGRLTLKIKNIPQRPVGIGRGRILLDDTAEDLLGLPVTFQPHQNHGLELPMVLLSPSFQERFPANLI